MGTVRALDAGTLSPTRLARLVVGADISVLTEPAAKQAELARLSAELEQLRSKPKRRF
jgi:hypothetical protein